MERGNMGTRDEGLVFRVSSRFASPSKEVCTGVYRKFLGG